MTAPSAVERTGELVFVAGGLDVDAAPALAAIPTEALFDFDRDPAATDTVVLPGPVRYRIGGRHRRYPDAVYLHRLP